MFETWQSYRLLWYLEHRRSPKKSHSGQLFPSKWRKEPWRRGSLCKTGTCHSNSSGSDVHLSGCLTQSGSVADPRGWEYAVQSRHCQHLCTHARGHVMLNNSNNNNINNNNNNKQQQQPLTLAVSISFRIWHNTLESGQRCCRSRALVFIVDLSLRTHITGIYTGFGIGRVTMSYMSE